ncbi:hypothetical protein FXO38_10595 [Capsicum annuum]|nr:hypothetical protein FXO38_10595 [Capsicum annuum]KAF3664578.1 hypothetical protein FXO37_11428 [Capsicum annuum]
MRVSKPPAQQTQSAPVPEPLEGLTGMPLPLTTYVSPTTSAGSDSMSTSGIPDPVYILPQYSKYRLNHKIFAKTVRVVKKVEKQMAISGKYFKPFVEWILEEALHPFRNIQLQMDSMEGDENEGLVDLFGRLIKDKGNKVAKLDENAEKAAKENAKRKRLEAMSPEQRLEYNMRKARRRFEKLAKELQKASPLGIMDKALEKFGDYIAIAFRCPRCQSVIQLQPARTYGFANFPPANNNMSLGFPSGRTSLRDDLYRILTVESTSAEEIFSSLNLTSENNALEVVNRIYGAILAWKEIIILNLMELSESRTVSELTESDSPGI